uniref:Uncharacterized protein n=1 Tax=Ditylenchus dipsaci TaxID=166011 RepID=A0A915DI57_9BILA
MTYVNSVLQVDASKRAISLRTPEPSSYEQSSCDKSSMCRSRNKFLHGKSSVMSRDVDTRKLASRENPEILEDSQNGSAEHDPDKIPVVKDPDSTVLEWPVDKIQMVEEVQNGKDLETVVVVLIRPGNVDPGVQFMEDWLRKSNMLFQYDDGDESSHSHTSSLLSSKELASGCDDH